MIKKLWNSVMILGALFLCAQYSTQESIDVDEKPPVNFYGTVIDYTNVTESVNYITISGRYNEIPFYRKPKDSNKNPMRNKTDLNLKDIDEIRVVPKPQGSSLLKFDKRNYIEVEVITNDPRKTKHNYIVEEGREVICWLVHGKGKREIGFHDLKQLKIDGYKTSEPECLSDLTISETKNIINKIERVTKKLPQNEKNAGIRGQLLKLVKDLKRTLRGWFT